MERKSITTSRAAVACDVCGRTLLRGEHADAFIANGSRRMVCELCTARATNEGWIREGADNALGVRGRNGPRGGPRSLLGRLKPPRRELPPVELPYRRISANVDRIDPARDGAELAPPDDAQPVEANGEVRPAAVAPAEPESHMPSREPRHVHAVPTNADLKMRARSTSSTPAPTRAGSPAWRARWERRPSPSCPRRSRGRS
jgi:hypothetical protein